MYEQVKKDLIEAMRSGDKFKLSVIKMLKSALLNEEINLGGNGSGLTDDQVLAVIKREVKKRNGSIEEYTKYGKMDAVEDLKKEVEVLSTYLPEEMSDEELNKHIDEIITEVGASSIKDMGRVMKELTAKYASQIDMGKASSMVKSKLN